MFMCVKQLKLKNEVVCLRRNRGHWRSWGIGGGNGGGGNGVNTILTHKILKKEHKDE